MSRKTQSPSRGGKRRTAGRRSRGSSDSAKAKSAAAHTEAIVVTPADPPALSAAGASDGEPRNHRELAQAIFAKCNAVEIGRELLESSSEKGASVRARIFETIVNWQFGKTGASPSGDRAGLHIIWDLPGPPRESEDAE